MSCKDFQANLHRYVDGELSRTNMCSAAAHAATCSACESLVTSSQQLHVLLTTAVTDRVAAVDVSGLWEVVEAELDRGPGFGITEPVMPIKKPSIWRRFGERLGTLVDDGHFIPIRSGALVAAAAAVALMVSFSATETESPRVGPVLNAPSQLASLPQPLVSPVSIRTRPVRIDSMEVAAGRNVTTWMRPKTKTRVIWVGESNEADGFGVGTATLER